MTRFRRKKEETKTYPIFRFFIVRLIGYVLATVLTFLPSFAGYHFYQWIDPVSGLERVVGLFASVAIFGGIQIYFIVGWFVVVATIYLSGIKKENK